MKIKQILMYALIAISSSSCSKSDSGSNTSSNTSCNEIVCGSPGVNVLYRGTRVPDNCGSIELSVNTATYNYYMNKIHAQVGGDGTCCWEGLK